MSTATLPEIAPEVTPSAPAAPAPKPAAHSAPEAPFTPSEVRYVEPGWEPKTLEDSIAFGLGEIKHKGEPKPKEPEAKPKEAEFKPGDITPDTTDADLDKHIDSIKFSGQSEKEAFKHKTYENRDLKRKLKEAEAIRAEAETLKAQIAELKEKGAPNPALETELNELKEKFAKSDLEIAAVRLERSEAYQQKIGKPMAAIENFANELAERYGIDKELMLDALRDTSKDRGEKISDVAAEIKAYDRDKFFQAARDWELFDSQKAEIMANAKAHLEAVQKEEAARAKPSPLEVDRNQWKEIMPEKWDAVSKAAGIEPIEGNELWNKHIEIARTYAQENHFSDLDLSSQAIAMQRATLFPLVVNKLTATVAVKDAEIAELKQELEKFYESSPSIGGGRRGSSTPRSEQEGGRRLTFEEAMDKGIREAEARGEKV